MDIQFDQSVAQGYKSKAQIARVLTEDWMLRNMYCVNCSSGVLNEFDNNRPVADFYCSHCKEEFELKSKKGKPASSIAAGAYSSMIDRICSGNSPHLFSLSYSPQLTVENLLVVPNQFFTKDIITKRKALRSTARRAGWVGCTIDLRAVPNLGKVHIVRDAIVVPRQSVRETFNKTKFLKGKSEESKGWLIDVLNCISSLPNPDFKLNDVYTFEEALRLKHPQNTNIRAKIRQQLQVLRDKGLIDFTGRGTYKKTDSL